MELRHIRYFLAVCENMSFTRAAEQLLIAQPPLSRQIKDLEEELGAPLFIRKTRSLELTEAGRHFREYATQILELADQSMEDIRDMNSGLQGTIYLATVEGQGPHLLAQWISAFHKLYPLVQFSLWNGNSDDVLSQVKNGLCDLAVIVAPYNQEGFRGLPVYTEPWVALIPPDHPLASEPGDTVSLKNLAPYNLIAPSRHSRMLEINSWFASVEQRPHIICRMASVLDAFELTAQGLGIAIFPEAAALYTGDSGVVVKKLTDPEVIANYVLIRSSERKLSLVSQEFLNFIMDELGIDG